MSLGLHSGFTGKPTQHNEGKAMAQTIDYTVTISRSETGEIDTERFYWYDYDNPNDLRVAVANYCNASVGLGWDVEAFDTSGKIVFTYKRGALSATQGI